MAEQILASIVVDPEYPLGQTLKMLRTGAGLSQQDMSKRLECGQSKVSKMEGRRDLRLKDLRAYATALGLRIRVSICDKKVDNGQDKLADGAAQA